MSPCGDVQTMKKNILLFFLLIACFSLCAQQVAVRNINNLDTCILTLTPGGIQTAITDSKLRTTENLVIQGSMDARDFRWIRSTAVRLRYLDLRNVSIAAYVSSEGTETFGNGLYPPNVLPDFCFYKDTANNLLTNVLLPNTLQVIGPYAFYHCLQIKKIVVPDSVKLIDTHAFGLCSNMDTIVLGYGLSMMSDEVFYGCNKLKHMEVKADNPPDIAYNTMHDTLLNQCELFLPFGSKSSYENTESWNLFKTIHENTYGVALDNKSVRFTHLGGSTVKIGVRVGSSFDKNWTVHSDRSWLKVSPPNGSSNDTISLEVELNPTSVNREALITLQAPGLPPKQVSVVQLAGPKTLALTAGTLSTSLTAAEKKDITDLTLTGTINKLDFDILSTRMPILRRLDLSETEVLSYNNGIITYAANTVKTLSADSLESVRLPRGTKVLGDFALYYCKILKHISLGDSLTTINSSAFQNCTSLTSIVFPATTTKFSTYCLSNCPNLRTITVLNPVPVDLTDVLESTAFPRITLYVPKEALKAYQNDSRWNRFQSIIELETTVDELKSKSNLLLYPNPFRESFSIQGMAETFTIVVTDLQGRMMLCGHVSNGESVSLPNSPPGMYLVRVHTKTANSSFKILKAE